MTKMKNMRKNKLALKNNNLKLKMVPKANSLQDQVDLIDPRKVSKLKRERNLHLKNMLKG